MGTNTGLGPTRVPARRYGMEENVPNHEILNDQSVLAKVAGLLNFAFGPPRREAQPQTTRMKQPKNSA